MPKPLITVLLAGLISAAIFLIVFGLGLGFIFMFLPTLPILAIGLSHDSKYAMQAVLAAAVIAGVAAGPVAAATFLLFLGLPAWYIAHKAVLVKPQSDGTQAWFPIGLIILPLTLSACVSVAVLTAFYINEPGGLPHMLSQNIHETFADLNPEFSDAVDTLANDWSYLIFSISIWMWGLALYAHAWLANRALAKRHLATRPDFAVHSFTMPSWMLSLLAICALASLIGSESMQLLGKACLISLMLPYFFLGAAIMHEASKTWPSRRFFLFFVYVIILPMLWPALILSGVGLAHQIKHLSGGGNWVKH